MEIAYTGVDVVDKELADAWEYAEKGNVAFTQSALHFARKYAKERGISITPELEEEMRKIMKKAYKVGFGKEIANAWEYAEKGNVAFTQSALHFARKYAEKAGIGFLGRVKLELQARYLLFKAKRNEKKKAF